MSNYLSVENISKSYGEKWLFQGVSFGISQGQKMALIAKNGEGKSTLFKLLRGKETPDSGQINWKNGLNVGHLAQDTELNPKDSIHAFLYQGNSLQIKAIKAYQEATQRSVDAEELQRATELMDASNAWNYEAKIKKLLEVFEMGSIQFDQAIGDCSGGQKKRLALIKLLVDEPDVLLLDEPTNHLDITMIEWLEEYLSQASQTVFLITHDRYFLNNVCDQILELDGGKAYRYQGNYEYFLEKKSEREQIEANTIEKQKNLYRREVEWMRRMPKARGSKSKSRQDQFHELSSNLKQQKKEGDLQLKVKSERLGTKIIELHHVHKRFGDLKILDDFSYTFKRKEKIGIAGKNGVGKSTFLNMVMGKESVDSGKIVQGETVEFGYYRQSGMNLKEDKRLIEIVKDIAEFIPLEKGRKITAAQLLERFLFPKEQHYAYVSKLSGGEKKRLYLLTILMGNPNFLILDEPTNDLDIKTLRVLEDFLDDFPACLLIVSHDRAFMDRLVDHVFYFEGEGKVSDFPGNYSQLLEKIKRTESNREADPAHGKNKVVDAASEPEKEAEEKPKKLGYIERREYNKLEKEIEKLEEQKRILSEALSQEDLQSDELLKKSEELGDLVQKIDEKTERWLELSERA